MGKLTISMAMFNSYVKLPGTKGIAMVAMVPMILSLQLQGTNELYRAVLQWSLKPHIFSGKHNPYYSNTSKYTHKYITL